MFSIIFIKTIFINLCITYSIVKIKNYTNIDNKVKLVTIIINILIGILYASIHEKFPDIPRNFGINLLCYIVYVLLIEILVKDSIKSAVFIIPISLCFAFISLFIASIITFIITRIFKSIIGTTMEFSIIGIIQFILVFLFFKIKRFKYGISFLKENKYIDGKNLLLIISICIILLFIIYGINNTYLVGAILSISILIGGFCMFKWIKKSITEYYKKQMKDRTVELQAEQLKEKDEEISRLKKELDVVLKINHKYSHRISAAHSSIIKLADRFKYSEEFGTEYADILDNIEELSKEYKNEMNSINNNIQKTNIYSIDNLIEYMVDEASKSKIDFVAKIECNMKYILDNLISKNKMETLLADHIKDAIIAINSGSAINKKIKLEIGVKDGFYEIRIYDTGIEFNVETLLKLGTEKVTTHKHTGGSGIGFITTFETLNECKASLIIEEYSNHSENYTKSIIIRFDGENKYKIRSYRANKIENKENRIIVEQI